MIQKLHFLVGRKIFLLDEKLLSYFFSRRFYNFKEKPTRMIDYQMDDIHKIALNRMSNNKKLKHHGTEIFSDSRKVHFFETKDFKR